MSWIKSEVVMLSRDTKSKLVLLSNKSKNTFKDLRYLNVELSSELGRPQHLYFISDEKIECGDWCYDKIKNSKSELVQIIYRKRENSHIGNSSTEKKIIASSDPNLNICKPSESFMKKYADVYDKNPIKEVMIEMNIYRIYSDNFESYNDKLIPRVDKDNIISIHKKYDEIYDKNSIIETKNIDNLKNYINMLMKESFEGWTKDEERGYLTACISIEKWIDKNL
jgi:hypothetical protein